MPSTAAVVVLPTPPEPEQMMISLVATSRLSCSWALTGSSTPPAAGPFSAVPLFAEPFFAEPVFAAPFAVGGLPAPAFDVSFDPSAAVTVPPRRGPGRPGPGRAGR